MYERQTRGIVVRVQPDFLDDQSAPDRDRYVWAYAVEIENRSLDSVRLVSRCWRITDAAGRIEEVRGDGVVGEQPLLEPGETFRYTSGAPLETPSGIMVGAYTMETVDGARFNVAIPAFSLDSPHETASRRPN